MSKNKVYFAVAGAGKTSKVAENIVSTSRKKRVAVISYAIRAVDSIREKLKERNSGVIPSDVDVFTWFAFLYHECILPYQKLMFEEADIKGISFEREQGKFNPFGRDDIKRYITKNDNIKSKEISNFIVECIDKDNDNLLIRRLEEIYEEIIIDEAQDLAGNDLDFVSSLMDSSIKITLAGDIRQATFVTHNSSRLKKYKKINVIDFYKDLEKEDKLQIIELNDCWRSNASICEFADLLFPDLTKANSLMKEITGHDGVFIILKSDLEKYFNFLANIGGKTQALKYDAKTKTQYKTFNFGECKGLTFDRTVIFANNPLEAFLDSSQCNSPSKYYVGLTRAKYSVAIVVDAFPKSENYKYTQLQACGVDFTIKEYCATFNQEKS